MSVLRQFALFAEYNQLMNQRQYAAATRLSEDKLNKDNKAFFKSIIGTLNHIMVGDIIWLKRFAQHPSSKQSLSYISGLGKPESLDTILFHELKYLSKEREIIDNLIIDWIACLTESNLDECITYTNMAGISFSKSYASLISHLFLHQVHHRGQITTLLSQYGVDFGETDLVEIINECVS